MEINELPTALLFHCSNYATSENKSMLPVIGVTTRTIPVTLSMQ